MSKEIDWGMIHGEGDIVCECDQCGEEERIPFEDGCIDYREAQTELKALGWVSRKIDDEWHDFCSNKCHYDYVNENK